MSLPVMAELSPSALTTIYAHRLARAVMLRHHYRDELSVGGFVLLERIIEQTVRDLEAAGSGHIAQQTLRSAREKGWV